MTSITERLTKTVLVGNRGAGGKGDVPKMIVIERRLFVDEEVALDSNYTREAECW